MKIITVAVLALALGGCAMTGNEVKETRFNTETDESINFSLYKTYNLFNKSQASLRDPRIDAEKIAEVAHINLENILTNKGFIHAEKNAVPDFIMTYNITIQAKTDNLSMAATLSQGAAGNRSGRQEIPYRYQEANLELTMHDPAKPRFYWRGLASGEASVLFGDAMPEKIAEAVNALFKDFPPKGDPTAVKH